MTRASGTYVFCLVAGRRPPPLARTPAGLPGLGKPRLLEVSGEPRGHQRELRSSATRAPRASATAVGPHDDLKKWLVVADAPLDRYSEQAINRHLSSIDWVARAAVGHEAVVESCIAASAVLPMKLFTIFTSDARARDHVRSDSARIDALIRRVAHHQEWGVRVILEHAGAAMADHARTTAAARRTRVTRKPDASGREGKTYLARKMAERDRATELARHARETVAELYERLAEESGLARRRAPTELPVQTGPLLLDAAFLVPAARAARFRRLVAREARALAPHGYRVNVTGPWPPYSFVQS